MHHKLHAFEVLVIINQRCCVVRPKEKKYATFNRLTLVMCVVATRDLVMYSALKSQKAVTQQTQDVESMLGKRWSSVVDRGPTLNHH